MYKLTTILNIISLSLCLLGSQRTQELGLFVEGLETAVSKLGTGIDKLEINLLQVLAGRVLHHTLAKNNRAFLDTDNTTLEHDPVLINFTIVDESTHGGNALLGKIGRSLATSFVALLTDAVNLLVELGTVKVTVLTRTRDSGRHTGRMPRSNTGNLAQTTMGLTGQTSDTPTGGHTLVTVTSGDSENINLLVLGEDTVAGNFLLKEVLGKVNLGGGIASVDLDLHNVSLL